MQLLQRLDRSQRNDGIGNGDPTADDRLQEARMLGDRLLAAGDEAIQRALARGNSEAFLRAGRQQGGQ